MADQAARLVVKVAALEKASEQRELTGAAAANSRLLGWSRGAWASSARPQGRHRMPRSGSGDGHPAGETDGRVALRRLTAR
jgi:hypothetical protein